MGGGKTPQVPQPSAAEQALQASQKEMLDLQRSMIEKSAKEQELLAPILYKQLGIEPQYDAEGKLTGYKEGPDAARKQSIESMLLDRSEAALKGELPVNPALSRDLGEQEAQLKERLFRQLGPGWETSTPGIEAMANFKKREAELNDASRRGDLTMAEALSLARDSAGLNTFGATMSAGNRLLPSASGAGSTAGGYGSAASSYAQDRLAQYQGMLQASANASKTAGGIGQGIGSLAGMALGTFLMPGVGTALGGSLGGMLGGAAAGGGIAGGAGLFSDRRVKKDIKRVGETEGGLPIFTFRYRGTDGPVHMGVMAQDVAEVNPDAVTKFGDIMMVDYDKVR